VFQFNLTEFSVIHFSRINFQKPALFFGDFSYESVKTVVLISYSVYFPEMLILSYVPDAMARCNRLFIIVPKDFENNKIKLKDRPGFYS
jgi:hypothetical protein